MRFRSLALPLCASVLAFYFLVSFAVAQDAPATPVAPRAITVDDAFEIHEVRDPQISDDGKWVAYTVSAASLKEDKTETRIWMAPTGGGDAIVMTAEDVSSSHPRWSPDGKYLAFLSKRNEGKAEVWLLNRMGGEAQKLTDAIQDVDDFSWSPDSKRLALILRDPSPEELAEAKTKDKEKPGSEDKDKKDAKGKKPKTPPPFVIDRYRFKSDMVGYLDHRRTHLYVIDMVTKAVVQITSGDFDDEEPAWSPDGKLLAFRSNRSTPDPDRTYDTNIWVVAADNTDKGAHLTQVTTNPGSDAAPAWSPDGKWITYITQLDPKLFQYATHHVAVSPAGGGQAKVLTQAFDRMSRYPRFSPDGQFIYFVADDDGTENLCRIPATGGEITRPISGHVVVSGYTIAKSGDLAAQITSIDRPSEIFTIASSGGTPTRITHVNDAFVAKIKMVAPEYVKFKSKDGTLVAGYLYKPLDYVAGKKYPALLHPHGGPVGAYYGEFNHFSQLLAANGYVVLEPNPRGSSGYGQDFCKAIFADWGNKDYQDDMAMVDYAIAQGFADPDKLGVGGWSYGGISTDFIIAQSKRFKGAISGAGSAFFAALYGHDQYILDYDVELGRPWENRAVWDKISPFYKVENITTPTLFMGGDVDWNVPIIGGEQMYEAMKSLGRVETELVVYPGEFHGFKTPSHIKDRLERNLSWYAHYVKNDGSAARPAEKTN
ncbi:MAG TPA: S9 family peptidase [Candidatus Sulfotelmatobacter sp.]|jgi:dipeptidyl aminopeptidase/acylaminoacyl peptidase|nr:S9 family peptidase [Candidatus Sulfotelmatobacter sp.]